MRNLKRVLSLALACVMVIGMMVMTTGAADFTDADEIKYAEAVEVANALGIIEGYNGIFNPEGELYRDQGAKFIAYLLLGKEKADMLQGTGKFTDVTWAAGYVEYCYNVGICTGYTETLFGAADTLTGWAFGKWLLVAMGNDADECGYNGPNYIFDITVDMMENGLVLDGMDVTETLTREQAAQMLLVALKSGGTTTRYYYVVNKGATSVATATTIHAKYTDPTDAYVMQTVMGTGNVDILVDNETTGTLMEELYDVSIDDTAVDDYGRPGHAYTDGEVNGFYMFYADTPATVYTAPVTAAAVAKAYPTGAGKWTWAEGSAAAVATAADYGVVVEIYTDVIAGVKTITDVVVIEEQLGKVTKVTEAKDEADRYVTVAGMAFETEDFAKGDVVLYTVNEAGDEIVTMAAVETVEGKIESYNDTLGTVTIGGVKYNYGHDFALTADFTKTYTFTLFSDGSIAAQAEKAAAAGAISTNYVYVVKTEYQAYDAGSTSLLGTINAKAAAAKAEVIFANGTKAVIDLTITDVNTDPTADPDYEVDVPATDGTVAAETSLVDGSANIGNWFAYTVAEDGTYTLTAINSKYAAVVDGLSLTKDAMKQIGTKFTTADTTITSVDSRYAVSNKTGFVAATLSGKVLYTYAQGSNAVAAIYAVGQTPAPAPIDTTIYYAVKAGNSVKGGTEWTFSAKGEQVTVVIKTGTVAPGGFYTLTALTGDDAGLYSAASASVTNTALVTLISGDQVGFSAGTPLTLSDKVNVYNIDETAEVVGEVKALEVGDVIYYTVNDGDSELANIWVYGVEATVEAGTLNAQDVLDKVPAGVTVALAEGTYSALTLPCGFDDMTIDGSAGATVAGIVAEDCSETIVNLTLKDIAFTADVNLNGLGGTVKNLTITGCSFGNGYVDMWFAGAIEKATVTENTFAATTRQNAITLSNVKDAVISANTIVAKTGEVNTIGVHLDGNTTGTVVISDNTIGGALYRGVRIANLAATAKVTISDNVFSGTYVQNELIKITNVAANATVSIKGNTLNGTEFGPYTYAPESTPIDVVIDDTGAEA